MQDDTLGGSVDVGTYEGPILDGKAIHTGSCNDGVEGCSRCNGAARCMVEADLIKIGWPTTGRCEWCKTTVKVGNMSTCRPWDEGGSISYEICNACRVKYDKEVQAEYDYDHRNDQDE